jgi:hypothetical protein
MVRRFDRDAALRRVLASVTTEGRVTPLVCGCIVRPVSPGASEMAISMPCKCHGGDHLRDDFAKAVLPAVMSARVALLAAGLSVDGVNDMNQESIAEEAYELADAMLEARSTPLAEDE